MFNQEYNAKYLDRLMECLPEADILEPGANRNHYALTNTVFGIGNKMFTTYRRATNRAVLNGQWYDEAKVREFIIDYINNPECARVFRAQHSKILQIYDRLAHLSKGNGTWADGIDRKSFRVESYVFTYQERLLAPTDRQLFHIQADEFGGPSKLEGAQSKSVVSYLCSYLEGISKIKTDYDPSFKEDLLKELQNAVAIGNQSDYPQPRELVDQTAESIQEKQKQIGESFELQKPLLLMGGWRGEPAGHAIYYEIIPHSPNSASFRLYNTGAGISAHRKVVDGEKVKYQTYCEWNGIDRQRLESAYFLEALYELTSYKDLPNGFTKTQYNEQDIYQGLKNLLEPKEEVNGLECELDPHLMISPQRTGVCAWKSLMAFLRTKMAEVDDYKRFKCDIKLQSLIDFVNGQRYSSLVSPSDWRLVQKSHQNLCRSIDKLYRNHLVGDAYIKAVEAALKPVSEWINSNAHCQYQKSVQEPLFAYKVINPYSLENKYAGQAPLDEMRNSKESSEVMKQPCLQLFENFKEIDLTIPSSVADGLKESISLANDAWINGEDNALHLGLISVVSNLPLDQEFWNQAVNGDAEKAESLIENLGEVADLFAKSCFTTQDAHAIFPEKIYLIHKILYLQQTLCQLGHPNSPLKRILLNVDNQPNNSFFLRFPNAKMQREMDIIFNSTERFEKKKDLKKIPLIKRANFKNEIIYFSFERMKMGRMKKPGSYSTFEDMMRYEYPEAIQRIADEVNGFATLPVYTQDAHIFASAHLPAWIKAMRESELLSLYIKECPVGALTSLDRKADFHRCFQIVSNDEQERAQVSASLTGVNGDLLTIPEVKNVNENKRMRYAGQYPRFISTPIKQFLKCMDCGYQEKNLINWPLLFDKIEMNDEERKELSRIAASSLMKHVETLEYFTKRPEKLKDPDYQILLHMVLFELGRLDRSLEISGFEDHLVRFVQRSYEQLKEENEIQAAVFLLKLGHQLESFCPNQKFFQTTVEQLNGLLKRKGMEPDEKCLIYSELLAQYKDQSSLTEEDVATLLEGSIYLQENQNYSKYPEDPYARRNRCDALNVHAKEIQGALERGEPNQQLLNRIMKTLRPSIKEDQQWTMVKRPNEFPLFSTVDKENTLYPMLSTLVSSRKEVLLPFVIRKNQFFRELFPGIEQAVHCPGDIFSFIDQKGQETLVFMKGDHIIIEQKQNEGGGKWFRYVPSSIFLCEEDEKVESLIGSRHLAQHYVFWQSLEQGEGNVSEIYAVDSKTSHRCYRLIGTFCDAIAAQADLDKKAADALEPYRIRYGDVFATRMMDKKTAKTQDKKVDPVALHFTIDEVVDIVNGSKLGKTSTLLANFEDPAYIHEWYDEKGALSRIELPRFNLSFKADPNNPKRLVSEQFSTYALTISHVKELGSHPHALLLENQYGEKKVIIPQQSFKEKNSKEVLLPAYEMDRQLERGNRDPQKYFTFDIGKNSELFNKGREANLYLAQVLGTAQEYKKAAHYLRKCGKKLSGYTPGEANVLRGISHTGEVTGDKSGNGVILQLYADYLLIKNTLDHHQEVPASDMQALRSHYNLYINHYQHVTAFKLMPREELFILKTLLSIQFEPFHYLRLKALDPAAAATLTLPVEKSKPISSASTQSHFKVPSHYKGGESSKEPEGHILLTRSVEAMRRHFLFFYEIARVGNESAKERLKNSLAFVRLEDPKMADFFEALLADPSDFPEPIAKTYNDGALFKWTVQVEAAAETQLAKRPQVQVPGVLKADKTVLTVGTSPLETAPVRYTPFRIQVELPALLTFREACLKSTCFHAMKGSSRVEELEQLKRMLLDCDVQDPVQKREIKRLIDDCSSYQQEAIPPVYEANSQDLSEIIRILSENKVEDKVNLQKLEQDILALANRLPDSPSDLAQDQLKKWGELRKVITLEELIVDFARNDYGDLCERNPALSQADIGILGKLLGSFLAHATRDQQRIRAELILSKLEKLTARGDHDSQEHNDLVNQLAQEMLSERSYDPTKRPAFLVFEYFANITMRPSQVNKLEKFLSGDDVNLVMEMIMGSGKSKVLLPLLGLLRADGKTLSMLIVPQPLFESVSQDTQAILQAAFSQSLKSLHFDRDTKFTKVSLERILDDLESMCKGKECLIMTSKSVQCLILKFVEKCAEHLNSPTGDQEFPDELAIMRKVLNILNKSGYPIIDEADTVLNVLHEVSFSRGKRVSPDTCEVNLLSELYRLVYEDESIKKLARVESDPSGDPSAPLLTEELYAKVLRAPLASKLVDRLGEIDFESPVLNDKVKAFTAKLGEKDRSLLIHYLCRDKDEIQAAQLFYDSLDEEIQNIIAFAGEQIAHLLPYTLTRVWNEKYGLGGGPQDVLALPFSAVDTPVIGSQFANRHITMNYTFQTYIKQGIELEMVEEQIKLLQEKAMREIASSGGRVALKDTEAGKAFALLRGSVDIPLFQYKQVQVENIVKNINRDMAMKRAFVSNLILPRIESFEEKMSCNPQNLVAMFYKVAGFTGTLWNGISMHHALKPEPEVGTDAKTLSLLWANSRDTILEIEEGSTHSMLEQLQKHSINYDMIADAGGYFKGGTSAEIAHEIAKINGKAVLFYDSHNEQTISSQTRDGFLDTPLAQSNQPIEDRSTFLGQRHTTGADTAQKRDAIGLVTVGRNMLLRDLLQSVWRLRGLDKSQRVQFLVSHEVAGIIRQKLNLQSEQPIGLEEILKFTIANQGAQQGRDNYKALKQELANLPQQILLGVLLNEKCDSKERLQAYEYLNSYWIKQAFFSSRELYGTLATDMQGELVVAMDEKECRAKIEEIFKAMPWLEQLGISQTQYLAEIDAIVNRVKECLPEYLAVPSKGTDDDETVEVERESETETETETELEVQESAQKEKINMRAVSGNEITECASFNEALGALKMDSSCYSSTSGDVEVLHTQNCPSFPLKSYLESDKNLSSYSSAFEDINMTINMLEWDARKNYFALLGGNRMDFHHLLIKDSKVTLMSQNEAAVHLNSSEYYNLTLGYNENSKKPTPEELSKIVKIKFLNGEAHYSAEEVELLRKWFQTQGVSKMKTLYRDYILSGYPKKAERYQNSPLQKLFLE